jgi:hypothetical protein
MSGFFIAEENQQTHCQEQFFYDWIAHRVVI